MTNPKLTIVTPSYNQARYIGDTIRSVLDQGYDNLEYIVMDGGSTDGSASIIAQFESELAHWKSSKDEGQGPAIIEGWQMATGSFVTWINSDDLLLPGSLSAIADLSRTGSDILSGNEVGIDENGWVLSSTPKWHGPRWMYLNGLLQIGQPGTFYRRSSVEQVGYFDRSLEFSMEFDLHLRLLRAGATYSFTDHPIAALRKHSETKSARFRSDFADERRIVYEAHVAGPLGSHKIREPLISALRYPYALRYVSPRNWHHITSRRTRRGSPVRGEAE